MLYSVRGLLELPDLPDDVRYLRGKKKTETSGPLARRHSSVCRAREAHHPHFGEVDQTLLCEIGRPLLNESQVCQIHPQVRHARRVAAGGGKRGRKLRE